MTDKKTVDLYKCYCDGVKPEIAYEYSFKILKEDYSTRKQVLTGNDLHGLYGSSSATHFIRMVVKEGKKEIGPLTKVDLTKCGIEKFIIRPYEQEAIDLETCYCEGATPIITFQYILKINRDKYTSEKEILTGREILGLAGKDSKTHRLRMFTKKSKVIVDADETIDLTKCGIERFVAEPLDCTEGFVTKNQFTLPDEDVHFLDSVKNGVDLIQEGNRRWLIFRGYKIPDGYNVEVADLAILIPPHYPTAGLDMMYLNPSLKRKDGAVIKALSNQTIEGKIYQRWSRHRSAANKWNPNIHNVESHVDLMVRCLIAEFAKR
ncbi:MAG: multiubiquitin domain-containing protein [Maribacter dokdonensis]|uniref:multiubiquitin domain-containing protein n=1 Tax=Maribacter dokdonensis TaxID=320912 RepID=UPI003267581C